VDADFALLRDRPFALLAALAERARDVLRVRGEAAREDGARVGLAFRAGPDWFVTPREDVREILFPLPLTRLPRSRSWLLGLANVRGTLVAVTDLGHFLGGPLTEPGPRARLLWINHPRLPSALLVDEVAGFRRLEPDATDVREKDRAFLGAIHSIGERNYRRFDIPRLAEDRNFLEASL
jgi:twitching motility protein PilI